MGLVIAKSGQHLTAPSMTWGGTEAAIAYAESVGATTWEIKLQPLIDTGSTKGAWVTLGKTQSTNPEGPVVSVAADGLRYVVCWEDNAKVTCAVVIGQDVTKGIAVDGAAPQIAFGLGGFALAHTLGKDVSIHRLDKTANNVGIPTKIAGANVIVPNIAPTLTGFAVRSGAVSIQRLDGSLAPSGAPIEVSKAAAADIGLTAGGNLLAVGWLENNAIQVVTVDAADNISKAAPVETPMNAPYGKVATIRGGGGTFGVAWSAFDGYIGYRAMGTDGAPKGAVDKLFDAQWDDVPVAATPVADGFLVAAPVGMARATIRIAHLPCK
jgi:hypothetical protein